MTVSLRLTPPTMAPPKPHEVHKLVSNLLAREEREQALQLCAAWMEPLNDSFLRFNYLCLAVRLGRPQAALDWLRELGYEVPVSRANFVWLPLRERWWPEPISAMAPM